MAATPSHKADETVKRKGCRLPSRVSTLERFVRQRHKAAIIGVGAVLIAGIALYSLFGPLSPEAVCRKTLEALDKKDVVTLLRLTHPTEIRRLRLTGTSVTAMLDASIWQGTSPPLTKGRNVPEPIDNSPVDRRVFSIFPGTTDARPESPILAVALADSQDQGWTLDLTWLIYSYCLLEGKNSEGRLKYARLCRENGIDGMMDFTGEFLDIAEVEQRAKIVAAAGR